MSGLGEIAAGLGLPVFPCGPDKRPVVAGGFKSAQSEPGAVRSLFAAHNAVMIGVPTGAASGIIAIDVDKHDGSDGTEWLDENNDVLPPTRTHRTRSGGVHLLFTVPDGVEIRNSAGRIAPGVDVRGEGGYIIYPPSPGYTVADGTELAEIPRWLVRACLKEPAPQPESAHSGTRISDSYVRAAVDGELASVVRAVNGQRNATLNTAAFSLGQLVGAGVLDKSTAEAELTLAARGAGLDPAETIKTIDSGLRAGMAQPRQIPEAKHKTRAAPAAGHNSDGAPASDEDATALSFAAAMADRIAYDHTALGWRVFRDGIWRADETGLVFDAARDYVRDQRAALESAPRSMAKMNFVNAVLTGARHDQRIAVSHKVWDRDPYLLGVPGGTVNLRTGITRESIPSDYIAKHTAVAPAPHGTPHPIWTAFLNDATRGDADVLAFLQRLSGYFLTGDVTEEVLTFVYGPGGNGKGVFISAITSILSDYAVSVPMEVFSTGGRLNLEYYRAQMSGARLVTASETEAGAAWAESMIKEMTGNEAPLSARRPYGLPFTFRPQFKISIVGNHAPKLKSRSQAMERRLRIVPFTNEPAAPDPNLKDKLVAEYPAILRWMLDGCLMWQRDRLGNAQAIKEATSTYFEAQDAFKSWLDEGCILAQGLRTPRGQAYAAFRSWCTAQGEDCPNSREFAELMARTKGIRPSISRGSKAYDGLGLRPASARFEDE